MSSTAGESQDLQQRLQQGEEQALGELFSRYRDRLWRTVRFRLDRRLSGRVDPDDILQESYLAAVQRLQHYADDPSLTPFVWLRLIVSQTLVDVHRRHVGAQMRSADREVAPRGGFPQATSVSLANQFLGRLTSPSHAAMRAEMAGKLEAAIESMNPIDQEVLALRHFEELSNSEVAEVLGIQQKAASIRYVRALARLKDIMAEMPGLMDE